MPVPPPQLKHTEPPSESKQRYPFEPDYAVAPGETLRETLETMGKTQVDLADALNMRPKLVNEIMDGVAPITDTIASKLQIFTGVPARMWNNLEANYRAQLSKKVLDARDRAG